MIGIIKSVNVSKVQRVPYRGNMMRTGIYKLPVAGPVRVAKLSLAGDEQADLRYHGGEDKAVYGYPMEHYGPWSEELERDDLAPGAFGENLTTEGLLETEVHVGDRFRAGTAILEVTQPRVPCMKLGLKLRATRVIKRMLETGRCGFYFRVIEEGSLQAGDTIERIHIDPEQVSIAAIYRMKHFEPENHELRARVLQVPALSPSWREALSK